MMSCTSLLYDTTPIHCTPLPLHPPLMNTHSCFLLARRFGLHPKIGTIPRFVWSRLCCFVKSSSIPRSAVANRLDRLQNIFSHLLFQSKSLAALQELWATAPAYIYIYIYTPTTTNYNNTIANNNDDTHNSNHTEIANHNENNIDISNIGVVRYICVLSMCHI